MSGGRLCPHPGTSPGLSTDSVAEVDVPGLGDLHLWQRSTPDDDASGSDHEPGEADVTATIDEPVTIACSRCGDGWTATQDPPSFVSLAAALDYAAQAHWQVDDDQLLCPDCSLRRACEDAGHVWGRWSFLERSLSGRPGGRVRHCRVCTTGQFTRPATLSHTG